MALWLTNDPDNYFEVYDKPTASNLHSYNGWDKTKRISLMSCDLKSLLDSDVPKCPNLVTLLLNQNDRFYEFSTINFFKFMRLLCVLDLSHTSLKEIPRSIKFLVNLQLLNLSWAEIECLLMEVSRLKKLKTLNLEGTMYLERVPQRAIIKLVNLRALYLAYSRYNFAVAHVVEENQLMFKDLEKLKLLKDLSINVDLLVNNSTLLAAITKVYLQNFDCNDDHMKSAISNFSKLHKLKIQRCSNIRKIEFFGIQPFVLRDLELSYLSISSIIVRDNRIMQNLSAVDISSYSMLKDVTWMTELPSLEYLYLSGCDGMKTVVVGDDEAWKEGRVTRTSTYKEDNEEHENCYFPKLIMLNIWHLQSLESISKLTFSLSFPSLKMLDVQNCPKLEDICLGNDSAKDMKYMYGEQEWWDRLKWQDEDTKSTFLSHFEPGGPREWKHG